MKLTPSSDLTPELAARIAVEGYVYLYPLITMEVSRRQLTLGPADAKPGRGPMGMFHHIREFPAADFKVVVRPNFDTLYSPAWLDVSTEPMLVSVPASDRYYLLPCYDMWTDVFAVAGTRTTGTDALTFALTPRGWQGDLPDGVLRFEAPTPTVWIIGRTQSNGPADYPAVRAFQDGLRITPLSSWGGTPPMPTVVNDPTVDTVTPPLDQVNAMSGAEYFTLGAQLISVQGPRLTDGSILARLARLGFQVGRPFDLDALTPEIREAIAAAPKTALATMAARLPKLGPVIDGWAGLSEPMGVYGNFYVKRAIIAMIGLGANPAEDAFYPLLHCDSDGEPLDGANRYVMHFAADALPPVDAFWSVTMYDEQGFQAGNELNRFAIGDRDPLVSNEDGSLDIYIQHTNPGPDKLANWLPAPEGPLGITMRLYWPRDEALSAAWTPPPVRKVG